MLSWFKSQSRSEVSYPPLPQGDVVYAVGDVHGRSDLLRKIFSAIDEDRSNVEGRVTEIYLGDYIDRGADSRGVIEYLLFRARDHETIFLRGNHEVMFEDFLEGRISLERWKSIGGYETLASYDIDMRARSSDPLEAIVAAANERIPASHRRFLRELRQHHRIADYFFVHAGVRPGIPLEQQIPRDSMWIREPFLSDRRDHGAIVVHGHTPRSAVEKESNRINIDTGAYMTNRLTCLRLDHRGSALFDTGSLGA